MHEIDMIATIPSIIIKLGISRGFNPLVTAAGMNSRSPSVSQPNGSMDFSLLSIPSDSPRLTNMWSFPCRFPALWRHLQSCQQSRGPSPDQHHWWSCPCDHTRCHTHTDRWLSQVKDLCAPLSRTIDEREHHFLSYTSCASLTKESGVIGKTILHLQLCIYITRRWHSLQCSVNECMVNVLIKLCNLSYWKKKRQI